ncbi:Transposase_IS4 [Hexamita inflata]|uniref:Transposase IS4 n=1 Tax=Hexamita inflata TaxID=28002 RepID=A0AA86UTH8_9EUKA|nr:Transposase IS4 [Hexamita inflata]
MSQEDALRIFRQYMNPSVVQRIITKTQAKLSSRITNLKQNERLRQKINNFDEYQFWTFIDVSLVMFLSPRSGIQEYWSTNEMLGNAFIKKLIQREHYFQIYQSISWEENESDISQNWLQKQIINNVQKQLINNFFDKTVLKMFKKSSLIFIYQFTAICFRKRFCNKNNKNGTTEECQNRSSH